MVPSPNGQMPAMARNSVDLPEPEGPVTSVRSPGAKAEAVGRDQRRAVGQFDEKLAAGRSRRSLSGTDMIEPVSAASAGALPIAASKPSRRATTARHSASVR